MPYDLIPHEEVRNRIEKLQNKMKEVHLEGTLLTRNVDIYYYSGSMQNSILFVPVEGEPVLFVKKSIIRAKEETPFITEEMPSLKLLPTLIKKRGAAIEKLGLDLDVLPYNQFVRYQKAFLETAFTDISSITRLLRSVKSEYEIELIRQSAKVVDEMIREIPAILKKGMTELELTTQLEKLGREKGHIGYIRTRSYNMELVLGMVASGKSAAVATSFDGPAGGVGITPAFPQGSGWKEVSENEPIIIDVAVAKNGYIIDQTRMAVIGELDQELEKAYELSLQIIKETEMNAKPGTLWSEHYIRALDMVEEAGMKDYFMGFKDDQAKFLGHGVGLELDELPVLAKGLDQPLEEGMVIAVEPKFTFPEKGVIGIENTYVVRKNGLEQLTLSAEKIIQLAKS